MRTGVPIIILTVLFTTGCVDKTQSESWISNAETSELIDERTVEIIGNNNTHVVQGVCGEEITVTDYIAENIDKHPEFANFDFHIYVFDDFGYYSPSDGDVLYKYDCDPFGAIDEPKRSLVEYQHINVGDEICGLRLESATGMLFDEDGEISLEQQELYFSGSIKLNGFLYICRGDELYCTENEILFLPDDGEWSGLPYHYAQGDPRYLGENYEFYWCGKAYVLSLGNVSDYHIPELSEGGHSVRTATVTISDLVIRDCFTDMFFGANYYVKSAIIDSIEFK